MVKISIISIGKIKDKYIRDGIGEFVKRISKYTKLSLIELIEEDENKGIKNAINRETDRIIEVINKKKSYNILLDLKGKVKTSEEMAEMMDIVSLKYSEINFIIGGSNGVGEKLKEIVDFKISFSSLTFPHQLMKLILLEQLYRWITINKNIKYHK